jgi:hypothetical protein
MDRTPATTKLMSNKVAVRPLKKLINRPDSLDLLCAKVPESDERDICYLPFPKL